MREGPVQASWVSRLSVEARWETGSRYAVGRDGDGGGGLRGCCRCCCLWRCLAAPRAVSRAAEESFLHRRKGDGESQGGEEGIALSSARSTRVAGGLTLPLPPHSSTKPSLPAQKQLVLKPSKEYSTPRLPGPLRSNPPSCGRNLARSQPHPSPSSSHSKESTTRLLSSPLAPPPPPRSPQPLFRPGLLADILNNGVVQDVLLLRDSLV